MKKFKVVLSLLLVVSILCLCGTALAKPPSPNDYEFSVGGSSSKLSASLTYKEDTHLEITFDPWFGYYNTDGDMMIVHVKGGITNHRFTGAIAGYYTVAQAAAALDLDILPSVSFFQSCVYSAMIDDFHVPSVTKVYVPLP